MGCTVPSSEDAFVAAQERAVALAETAKLPDLSLTAAYSYRLGLGDFFEFMVSAPLPIFAGRKQDQAQESTDRLLYAAQQFLERPVLPTNLARAAVPIRSLLSFHCARPGFAVPVREADPQGAGRTG